MPVQAKSPQKNAPTFIHQLQDLTVMIFSAQYLPALDQIKKSKFKNLKGELENRFKFMLAYLQLQSGAYDEAAKGFEKLDKPEGLLRDYIEYYRALALREAGKPDGAIKIFETLHSQDLSPYLKKKVEKEWALSYCEKGDREKALAMLDRLIQAESSEIGGYQLKFLRARCRIRLGVPQEALPELRSLYLNYPEGDLSDDIRDLIKEFGKEQDLSPGDHVQRGLQLMAHQRPALAVLDFEAAMKAYGNQAPLSLKESLAEAYFKAREYPQAATLLEQIQKQYPSSFNEEKRDQLAKAYARSDQFEKAIRAYQEILALSPKSAAPDLEYKIAFLYSDKGDYPKAHRMYLELLDRYPQHPQREKIYWQLAWGQYLLKNYSESLRYLDLLEMNFPRGDYANMLPYWRARILEKTGQEGAAKSMFQNIADTQRFSYYGFLSLKRLEKNLDPSQAPKNFWTRDLPRLSVPAPFSLAQWQPSGDREIQRLRELLLLGLWEDFLGELQNLSAQEGISGGLRDLKNGVSGMESMELLYPEERWSLSYPPAYATLVSLFSQTRRFPMALAWAIMREESGFRPSIVSPAQAIGLMQIIPPTGMEISKQLNRNGFVPDQLYQPVTNIEFGVHYLATNREKFKGGLPETIASYNAGPHNVERWLQARPNREWDEFIEEIPYKETNNYVKKVLKSYYIYSLLYFP